MAEFKDRLKELRLNAHMTQKDLGQALGISSSTVGMYEQGKRTPDYETLEALADIFNVDTDYLIGRSNRSMYYILRIRFCAKFVWCAANHQLYRISEKRRR